MMFRLNFPTTSIQSFSVAYGFTGDRNTRKSLFENHKISITGIHIMYSPSLLTLVSNALVKAMRALLISLVTAFIFLTSPAWSETNFDDLVMSYLCLLVSVNHTQLVQLEIPGGYVCYYLRCSTGFSLSFITLFFIHLL